LHDEHTMPAALIAHETTLIPLAVGAQMQTLSVHLPVKKLARVLASVFPTPYAGASNLSVAKFSLIHAVWQLQLALSVRAAVCPVTLIAEARVPVLALAVTMPQLIQQPALVEGLGTLEVSFVRVGLLGIEVVGVLRWRERPHVEAVAPVDRHVRLLLVVHGEDAPGSGVLQGLHVHHLFPECVPAVPAVLRTDRGTPSSIGFRGGSISFLSVLAAHQKRHRLARVCR